MTRREAIRNAKRKFIMAWRTNSLGAVIEALIQLRLARQKEQGDE